MILGTKYWKNERKKNMEKTEKMKTAVVGCGSISDIYLKNMMHKFSNLEVISCCARHLESAVKKAEKYGIKACTFEEILEDSSVEMLVILTPAPTHYELIRRGLMAGKHVYTEKTMTVSAKEAEELLKLAEEKGLYLGSAPDTFLGAALQTGRKAIDDRILGEVTSFEISANREIDFLASIFTFLRMPGGGICYDYGVYYLTALVSLLGPVERVAAIVKNRKEVRKNICKESSDYGKEYSYPNESQVSAVIELENGISGTFSLNGDSIARDLADFKIYGTKGVLTISDPNQFGGDISVIQNGDDGKVESTLLEPVSPYSENCRGIGPSEMAQAIREGKKNRASKEMAYHVLDTICQMMKSSDTGAFEKVESTCSRPEVFR